MEKYRAQLEQVNFSIAKNSENKQLLTLKTKLEQILALKAENECNGDSFNQVEEHPTEFTEFPLQVGEACEIFDEKEKYWRAGNIVSMTLERDFYIVKYSKDNTTHRISSGHVRRSLHDEKKAKRKAVNKMTARKPQTFRPRKVQSEPEGSNQWKKFADKMIKR